MPFHLTTEQMRLFNKTPEERKMIPTPTLQTTSNSTTPPKCHVLFSCTSPEDSSFHPLSRVTESPQI